MKIEKLNKTNLSENILSSHNEIEQFLGKEIESVITFKVGFSNGFCIMPFENIESSYRYRAFKPFSAVNHYSFDRTSNVLTVNGRDKWKRSFSIKKFQLEKVGYKLETTHLCEGWIYGNPVEI